MERVYTKLLHHLGGGGGGGGSQWPMAHFGIFYHVRFHDVIWRTDCGKNGEFLVFMDAEDSLEGLVKVAMRKKVYKCLEVC